MQRLDRASVPTPACLVAPPVGARYNDLRGYEREEIRTALLELQRNRCAYCERRTGDARDDGHIEHFRNQAGHNDLELLWENLFWSCNDEKTCGKHKDKCVKSGGKLQRFDPDDILDPNVDNPDEFLLFVVDGTVRVIDGLGEHRIRRASETLRVFQLADSPFLRRSREDAVRPYLTAIESLLAVGQDVVVRYVQNELANVHSVPFGTTIRQYLEGFIP